MRHLGTVIITLLAVFCVWSTSFAAPIDLSTFDTYPGVGVDVFWDINTGTTMATFTEDPFCDALYLYNDNYLVADDATNLTFDYSLSYGQGDYLDHFVFELNYSPVLDIVLNDNQHLSLGLFDIDLMPYRGTIISLAWGLLWSGDLDAGSEATISNIDLATEDEQPAPVPEPGTMLLLGSGLVGLASFRKRIMR